MSRIAYAALGKRGSFARNGRYTTPMVEDLPAPVEAEEEHEEGGGEGGGGEVEEVDLWSLKKDSGGGE